MNYEHYRSTDLTVDQYGTGSELLSTFNSVNDDTYYKISQDISAYQTLGFFARVNYDFAGKYLFEASIRADGTSRFAKKDRWGYFPSASAGWRFTEEDFMNGVRHWWDNGKIRFSYGALGNQQVSNYLYIDRITTGTLSYAFDDSSVVKYSSVTNPLATDLTWETVYTYNWGLDLSFLRNRLSFTGDYFIRDTKDMLTTSLTLPDAYGASTPKGNCANLRTKGWEVSISWKDQFSLAGKPFHYGITGQIGDYQTTITKYNNPTKIFSDYYEGKKIGEIWGYHVVGLFKSDEEAAAYQKAINNSTNVYQRIYNMKPTGLGQLMAGDVQFEDTDNSGSIGVGSGTVDDPGDMRIIGNTTPRYGYSFRLEASWNGLDISAFFQGVGKRDWYPTANNDGIWGSNMFWQLYSYPIVSFVAKDFMKNVWTEDNTDAYFPRLRPIICYNGGPLGQNNDRYLQDISYLRFKNLTIGYTLPVLTKHISKIRIYVSGENLYYWSPLKKYNKNIDPELAGSTGTYTSGSGTGYLMPKIYSFGVDLTF
jgi:TonB-linked SusC/RagA family outer membrane protein